MTSFQKKRLGKYLLLDKLAVGGMAELYRAMITGVQGFEKLIAVKKILPHLATEEELVRSFIDEAKLAALLHHQNIVQIYDFGSLEDTYFIAMEYLLGKDCRILQNRAKEKNMPLSLSMALLIVSRICAGLDYAHKIKDFHGRPLNIIHRDISPQNILITYEGEIKIVDFGIAKAATQTTMTQMGMIKGKVAYMSPEQSVGKAIDKRSDIFSCGILLYEMITGHKMFYGDTMHILSKVREADFVKPEELNKDIPEEVLKVIYRALQKEPDDRYPSCGDMLTDLEDCMHQLSLHPTTHALAQYMKDIFSDEISAEELHLQEITQIRCLDDEDLADSATPPAPMAVQQQLKKQSTSLQESEETVVTADTANTTGTTNKSQQSVDTSQTKKDKKPLIAGILVSVVCVILLFVFIGKKEEPVPVDQAAVTEPAPQQQDTQEPTAEATEEAEVAEKPASPGEVPGAETYRKAMNALVAERYEDAISLFEEMLALGPAMKNKFAVPYAEAILGKAEKTAKFDEERAIALFEKSIQLDPESEQAHFQLGLLFMKQKDYSRAIESYQNVIELNPEFADTFFNLGFIHALAKDYARAEEMYTRAVELAPDYLDEALFNLALVQNKLGKKDQARANLQQAVSINPDNELAQKYLKKIDAESTTGEMK